MSRNTRALDLARILAQPRAGRVLVSVTPRKHDYLLESMSSIGRPVIHSEGNGLFKQLPVRYFLTATRPPGLNSGSRVSRVTDVLALALYFNTLLFKLRHRSEPCFKHLSRQTKSLIILYCGNFCKCFLYTYILERIARYYQCF